MIAARITTAVVAASVAIAALAGKAFAMAGFRSGPIRYRVAAVAIVDALLLWGIFDRRAALFGRIVTRGHPRTPAIAITFDDGPTEPYTSQILDTLQRYEARATFFVLGRCAELRPSLLRRMVAEGHEVANHGWDHAPLALRTPARIRDTIARTSSLVAGITGHPPRFFRAPFGWRNPWVNRSARLAGCEPVAWTVGVHDTDRPGVETIVERSVAALRNGTILLLHDGRSLDPAPDASQVVEALPAILEAARARGLSVITLSALLASASSRT